MRAWQVLMGPLSEVVLECLYICMSVCNGFTTKVYKFTYPPACAPLDELEFHDTMEDIEERQ